MIKKKILILGANGLLGNRFYINLLKNNKFKVFGTCRKKNFFLKKDNLIKFDLKHQESIKKILKKIKPNYVINCIGITNKKINFTKYSDIIKTNSLFPHYLDELSIRYNFKFIHIKDKSKFR